MELLPQEEVEGYHLDGFVSQDQEHVVRWFKPPDGPYPVWWCITHSKPYYTDCALEDPVPKNT